MKPFHASYDDAQAAATATTTRNITQPASQSPRKGSAVGSGRKHHNETFKTMNMICMPLYANPALSTHALFMLHRVAHVLRLYVSHVSCFCFIHMFCLQSCMCHSCVNGVSLVLYQCFTYVLLMFHLCFTYASLTFYLCFTHFFLLFAYVLLNKFHSFTMFTHIILFFPYVILMFHCVSLFLFSRFTHALLMFHICFYSRIGMVCIYVMSRLPSTETSSGTGAK